MRNKFYLLIASSVIFVGCMQKDMFKDIHVYPETSIPMGFTSVSDSSLFAMAGIRGDMSIGADGVLAFVDSKDITISSSSVGSPMLELGDQSIAIDVDLQSFPVTGDFIDITTPIEIKYSMKGLSADQIINSISFTDGQLSLSVNGLNVQGYDPRLLKFTVPSLQIDGHPMVLTSGDVFPLGPSHLFLLPEDNVIKVYISGRVPKMSRLVANLLLAPGPTINSASGFFGHKQLSTVRQAISIPEDFSSFTEKTKYVNFANPSFDLNVTNEYNVPILAKIESLEVDGQKVELKPGIGGQSIYIPSVGQAKLVIDNSRTVGGDGISKAMTKSSKNIVMVVSSILNPLPEELGLPDYVPAIQNSMTITDKLAGVTNMNIPLDCVLDGAYFNEDIEVSLSKLESNEVKYKQIDFTLSGTNEMPLDLKVMPRLRGADGKLVNIFVTPIIFPASVNNMRPTDVGFKPYVMGKDNMVRMSIPDNMIAQLLKADKLYIELQASTKNASQRTPVKLYSPSVLKIQIVLGAKMDVVLGK